MKFRPTYFVIILFALLALENCGNNNSAVVANNAAQTALPNYQGTWAFAPRAQTNGSVIVTTSWAISANQITASTTCTVMMDGHASSASVTAQAYLDPASQTIVVQNDAGSPSTQVDGYPCAAHIIPNEWRYIIQGNYMVLTDSFESQTVLTRQ